MIATLKKPALSPISHWLGSYLGTGFKFHEQNSGLPAALNSRAGRDKEFTTTRTSTRTHDVFFKTPGGSGFFYNG